jgi:hypothetical protein
MPESLLALPVNETACSSVSGTSSGGDAEVPMHSAVRRTGRRVAALLAVVMATTLAGGPAHAARPSPRPTIDIHAARVTAAP